MTLIGNAVQGYRIVRAKFKVNAVEYYDHPPQSGRVKMSAIHDTNTPENERFTQFTPSGELSQHINNPSALEVFKPGKVFYVDFIPEVNELG